MKRLLLIGGVALFCAAPGLGDWDPGDGHKMHFPQLPDPDGWDVNATAPPVLADDWLCTGTGPVDDIHFWGSWQGDIVASISGIHVSIHDNIPGPAFSHPGALRWERDFIPGEWTERNYGTGDQGWYNPNAGLWINHDHFMFYQYNIEDIFDPFIQEEGQIYWLDISVLVDDPAAQWGWKTSLNHWEDDGVWGDYPNPQWQPLEDPITGETLDLAFVITPEPAALGLLLFGSLLIARRR